MKRLLLLPLAALLFTACEKAEDPTAALDKSVLAVHDSIMALDGYLTTLKTMLEEQATKVDTNLTDAEARNQAIAQMAVFQKEAVAVGDAQVAMQEWMKSYGQKPAPEKPVEERVTWYNEQLTAIQRVAQLYGTSIREATQSLTEAGAEVPPPPATPASSEGHAGHEGEHEGHGDHN